MKKMIFLLLFPINAMAINMDTGFYKHLTRTIAQNSCIEGVKKLKAIRGLKLTKTEIDHLSLTCKNQALETTVSIDKYLESK